MISCHYPIGRFGESDDDEIAEEFDDFSARNHGSAQPNAHQPAQVARPPHQSGQSLERTEEQMSMVRFETLVLSCNAIKSYSLMFGSLF